MRCRKCGIQIPNGTLCEDCYNGYRENIETENDNKLLLKITRKFLPNYEIIHNAEWIVFCIVMFGLGIYAKNILTSICSIILLFTLLGIKLIIKKRIAVGTKCFFYEKKVVYTFDFLFIHRKKVLKYSEIKDITYNQKKIQKKFGLGSINVFSKKSGFIFNGFIIEDVANIDEVVKKLVQLVGDKIY